MSKPIPVFEARSTEQGGLVLAELEKFRRHLATLAGKPLELVVRRKRAKRSNEANRYYWGIVIPLIAEELGYDKDDCHEVLAMHFLRIENCPVTGAPRRKRTPDCDSAEFAEYVEKCIRLAAEHGVYVPQPGEAEVST